ncbi:MAG: hypothetical protein HYY06_09595 [Deltaproteobacteria bacterium]|nr:hypothetical protein [Deltaproteobacteria bacterium]
MGGKLIEAEAFGAAFLFALIIALVPGGVVGGIVVAVAAARRRSRAAGTAGAAPERSALGHLGLLWLKTTMGIAIGVALAVLLVAGVSPHLESRIGYPYSALVSAGLFALYLAVALYALSRPARERRLYLKIPGIVAAVLLLPGLVLWLIAALFGRG